MHDAQDQDHPVIRDHVVHDPVVADAQAVEWITRTPDGLDGLATDPAGLRDAERQLLELLPDPRSLVRCQFRVCPDRAGRQPDLIHAQSRITETGQFAAGVGGPSFAAHPHVFVGVRQDESSASSTGSRTAAGRPRFVMMYAVPPSTSSMTDDAVAFSSFTPICATSCPTNAGDHLGGHFTQTFA